MAKPAFDISMIGDKALERKLSRLAATVQKKVVRKAMRDSLKRLKTKIVARAPVRTGALKAALAATKIKPGARSRSRITMTFPLPERALLGIPADAEFYYPAIVEYGRKGVPPKSYIRSTVNENEAAELQTMGTDIGKGIEREAAR